MTSIGETLRRERLRRNLDLGQIANETKISAKLLEAIEAEQFDKLPGGVFTRSFVRQYANALGLDADELLTELDRMLEPEVPSFDSERARPDVPPTDIRLPKVEEWQQVGDSRRWSASLPALALVVAVMLVCSGVYAWWQRRPAHTAPPPDYTTASSQHATPAPPAPAPQTSAEPQSGAAPQAANPAEPQAQTPATAPGQTVPAAANPAQTPVAQTPVVADRQAPVTQPPPKAPVQTPGAAAAGQPPAGSAPVPTQAASVPKPAAPNPNATVHVQLTAEEPTWVLVRSDGKYLFSGTLQANETKSVEATGSVLVRLGNAGGVGITLNGKPLGPVGPKGQVRTVQLSSAGYQIVQKEPAAPPKTPAPDPL